MAQSCKGSKIASIQGIFDLILNNLSSESDWVIDISKEEALGTSGFPIHNKVEI